MKPYKEEDKIGIAYLYLTVYALLGEMSLFPGLSKVGTGAMAHDFRAGQERGGLIDGQARASAVIVERYPYLRHSCRMYPAGTFETVVISGLLRNEFVV